jgi:hypothetical protein
LLDLRGVAHNDQREDGLTQLANFASSREITLNELAFDVARKLGGDRVRLPARIY